MPITRRNALTGATAAAVASALPTAGAMANAAQGPNDARLWALWRRFAAVHAEVDQIESEYDRIDGGMPPELHSDRIRQDSRAALNRGDQQAAVAIYDGREKARRQWQVDAGLDRLRAREDALLAEGLHIERQMADIAADSPAGAAAQAKVLQHWREVDGFEAWCPDVCGRLVDRVFEAVMRAAGEV
ncbi:hypothetical protein [Ferruginivarius sediminum]|uniref:Twin-arginine translocation signal domain-containing protein n=1 Tax=Ferruginivarius sediminum TaxID=2661937 RepID=A0A369T846_9PROT|nr:hypothetical protein [Ferruginivarius sediminum]RDD61448.1 hypothetical protein DRB17_13315 [Ferruginivarius sediminum]